MAAAVDSSPEHVLCDTSFVGHQARRLARPQDYEHWQQETLDRLDVAVKAISVITIAEHRRGYLKANWGARRIADAETRLQSYLPVPLDEGVLDEWARLKQQCESCGLGIGDNDLWIAATASSRGISLATCDQDHARIEDPDLDVIYLAPPK